MTEEAKYLAIGVALVGLAVRVLKAKKLPFDVPKQALPWLSIFFGVVYAALAEKQLGKSWEDAVLLAIGGGVAVGAGAMAAHDLGKTVPGAKKLLAVALILTAVGTSACTPDARRALLEKGFAVLQCALQNMNLPNEEILVRCAVQPEDADRILAIVGEQREAQSEAVVRARHEADSAACRNDAGAP